MNQRRASRCDDVNICVEAIISISFIYRQTQPCSAGYDEPATVLGGGSLSNFSASLATCLAAALAMSTWALL